MTIFPPEIGGPATQAAHLCDALRARGSTPIVLAFDKHAAFSADHHGVKVYRCRLRHEGKTHLPFRLWDYALFSWTLRKILKLHSPAIVHCNSIGFHALIVSLVCRAYRIPSIVKFASDLVWEVVNRDKLVTESIEQAYRLGVKARLVAIVQRLALERFTLVWATSNYRKRTLVDLVGMDPDRIRVFPNYIRLPETSSRRRVTAEQEVSLVTGGRLVPHKRFEDCLTALALLPNDNVSLRFYGENDERRDALIASVSSDHGMDNRIVEFGKLSYDDLIALLASSDIYVSTSIEEGFPITLIEAMAVGLPIIAVRRGAIPELVPEGRAGFLYEPGDLDGLVAAISRLIQNPTLRQELGDFGAEYAKQFDLVMGVETFYRVYQEAIALVGRDQEARVSRAVRRVRARS